MLKSIFIVTILVRQLTTVESAYTGDLGYRTVVRGAIDGELAAAWNTPAMLGQPFLVMQPSSGADVYLRFIENISGNDPPEPLTTHGWAAAELLVTDPDALARRLEHSAFRVIGPPRDLYPTPNAPRAMQAQGPEQEILYFTRAIPGGSRYELGSAVSVVDRPFIVVAGGASMVDMRRFYADVLGLQPAAPSPFLITVLARANGLPPETRFPLAVVPLSPGHLIELDEYPVVAQPRKARDGALPPGISMVSFISQDTVPEAIKWRNEPRPLHLPPYDGRKAGVVVGAAGEWIEIVGPARD